jgi:hypothetical protein
MRCPARIALLPTLVCVVLFLAAVTPAAQASFGVAKFEAGTCNGNETEVKSCEYTSPHSTFYTQAAGHPPWGLTGVELAHENSSSKDPEGAPLKRLRVDVPPGLAADPQALATCTRKQFNEEPKLCPTSSEAGFVELEAVVEVAGLHVLAPPLTGKVYNLDQEPGLPLLFGITVEGASPIVSAVHLILEGHVSYAKEPALEARGVPSGNFHEWFEINNIPPEVEVLGGIKSPLKTLKSKLFFNGRAGNGNFLTLPSVCGAPSLSTSYVEVESDAGEVANTSTVPPVGVEGCGNVPFAPTVEVKPETAASDQPDGVTTVVQAKQNVGAKEINTADIQDAHVTLPEGLTLNASAAHGLETCSPAQIAIGTTNPVTCPAGSKVGTVTIETDLPPGSLTGNVYLGDPGGGPITEPPYTIYLDAESIYGVSVRLQGSVTPNPSTGRLEVSFPNNPQLPFSELILTLNGGEHAPLANPLACGSAATQSLFSPYTTGELQTLSPTPFVTTGCANPLPFALTQSTQSSSPNAGGYTNFTFNLTRADGQQYLSQIHTTLPPGVVGLIPSVILCDEPQANAGTCPAASEIGTANVTAGSGEPYPFTGRVYLTGPYDGAPYGLSIAVPAIAGPFDLGTVVTRASISVDPHTARVIVSSSLPTIAQGLGRPSSGVPLRLRSISVAVTRPNFMLNPTNCSALSEESTLTSTLGAIQSLSSPFQVGNCSALAFKPTLTASTSAHISKAGGASLQVSIVQPAHEANIASVFAQLPKQLPSRLTTLQRACPEATFAANPLACRPLGSEVGTATVSTPVLPGLLTGSAYLVSHGGAAFPDLDIVLAGDGVTVVLTGGTDIKNGITSSTFASIPDVPISSFTLNLPVGPHSALTGLGNFCTTRLFMPTTITAQNGAQIKQATRITVGGCGVRILSRRVHGHTLILRLRTLVGGRTTITGKDLRSVAKTYATAKTFTVEIPLARSGLRSLHRHRHIQLTIHVTFVPKQRGLAKSSAATTVKFKR